MPKASPIQTQFTTGEVSPLLLGRLDADRYKGGMNICKNYITTLQGGLIRRSGTRYVAEVKDSSKFTRVVPFEYNIEQAYIIEFSDQFIRFYKDNGQIVSGTPVQVATPYLEADLPGLKFTQSADTLYIVHKDYAPRKLLRTSDTVWTLSVIDFQDGPYLPVNVTATTISPSASTGSVNLTLSAVTGVNDDVGWLTTDVGRLVRLPDDTGQYYGWAKITSRTTATVAVATVISTFNTTTSPALWSIGLWSDTTGYPATASFHEDRLWLSGMEIFPQRMDASETANYENFLPTQRDSGSAATILIKDSDALSLNLNAENVNAIKWHTSDEKGLTVGTVGGEWLVRPSANGEALTPSNLDAKRSTSYGSADIQGLHVGKATLMVQRSGRKIRELAYNFEVDGFRAPDITLLSEHITQTGITEMAHQKEPQPVLWCVRTDGALAGMTYERTAESLQAGWHRHIIGGVSDAGGNDAKVESVAVIPSADGTREELWMIVQRYVDGSVVRFVEYMERIFDDEVEQKDACFVDSSLTYDVPIAMSAATKADPCVITTATHSFSDGDKVLISDVLGMTELNGNSYLVANKTATTFEITTLAGVDIDSSAFTTYVSGGKARKYVSNISGLDHLEGETVSILGDGAVHPPQAISSGAIVLTTPATTITVGLKYQSDGQLLRFDAGSADGTSIGKTRRTHRVGLMLHRSLGLQLGTDFSDLSAITFRTSADALGRAPALFTGITSQELEADYDFENLISWRQEQPLPSMILAVMPQMNTQDR